MKYYKVTTWDMRGPHNGKFHYDPPKEDGSPGAWTPVENPANYCEKGYHVTLAFGLIHWYAKDRTNRIFEVECQWPNGIAPDPMKGDNGKAVASSIRLVKEVYLDDALRRDIPEFDGLVEQELRARIAKTDDPELSALLVRREQLRKEMMEVDEKCAEINKSRQAETSNLRTECRIKIIDDLEKSIDKVPPQQIAVELLGAWIIMNRIKMSMMSHERDHEPWTVSINASQFESLREKIQVSGDSPEAALDRLAGCLSGKTVFHMTIQNPDRSPFAMKVPLLVTRRQATPDLLKKTTHKPTGPKPAKKAAKKGKKQ